MAQIGWKLQAKSDKNVGGKSSEIFFTDLLNKSIIHVVEVYYHMHKVVVIQKKFRKLILELHNLGGISLPVCCRLPTAMADPLPFADGNQKHGKTTSILTIIF